MYTCNDRSVLPGLLPISLYMAERHRVIMYPTPAALLVQTEAQKTSYPNSRSWCHDFLKNNTQQC